MEESALDHLESCQEQLENINERPIIFSAGRVSIYTSSMKDSIECYKALKIILGNDLSRLGPNTIRRVLKEERKDWNRQRKRDLVAGSVSTRGSSDMI